MADETPTVVTATAKYVRVSARKARLVADLVRGKHISEARAILAFSTRGAAEPVRKVLDSAAANADHNHGLDGDDLVLARVVVDEGPTMKRFRPRAMGRASSIHKRTCHISISVAPAATRQGSRRS
ncbi:MAG: 50S ribosomal protein L22 [Actinobacteria bacterium]|nr:50S ribosomal protein L22 [Actinomycetota bacterium]